MDAEPQPAQPGTVTSAPTIDRRSRRRADIRSLTAEDLIAGDLGAGCVERNGALAAATQHVLDLPPLTIDVDGSLVTVADGAMREGTMAGAATATITPAQLSDLVAGAVGFSHWVTLGRPLGSDRPRDYVLWDFVLRALFDGTALHDPASIPPSLTEPGGAFDPAADDCAIAERLAGSGYVALRSWVDPSLLPEIEEEVRAAAAAASPDDQSNLWTRLPDGTDRCVRLRYLHRHSPTMVSLLESDLYERLGSLFDDGHRLLGEESPTRSEALIKPRGHVADVTDLPWHRDCSGSHSYGCASYVVGLPLSATNLETGVLQVVAGSHAANVPAPGLVEGTDWGLPAMSIPTEPGDLTVHLSCALHRTIASTAVERTVVYSTFGLPPL